MCKKDDCVIIYGECHCGCNGITNILKRNDTNSGLIKGEPRLYLLNHHIIKQIRYIIDEETGCWEWQLGKDGCGYGQTKIKGKTEKAHILYYEQKYGPIPKGLELDHFVCQNPGCCNPDHVEPVTHTENMRRASNTKLNMNIANEIREKFSAGNITKVELAAIYGVGKSSIGRIVRHESWEE